MCVCLSSNNIPANRPQRRFGLDEYETETEKEEKFAEIEKRRQEKFAATNCKRKPERARERDSVGANCSLH